MKVRALDENHDWTMGHKYSSDAIAQNVKTAILRLFNDWFLDPQSGIKWFNYLSKNPNLQALQREIKNEVLSVKEVAELNKFDIKISPERKATINLTYTDIYGLKNEVSVYANY